MEGNPVDCKNHGKNKGSENEKNSGHIENEPTEIKVVTDMNMLNNDCLRKIFEFLPICDKIKFERTCKRWQYVSQSAWNDFNKLDIGSLISDFLSKYGEQFYQQIVQQFISRGGIFIKEVNLTCSESSTVISYETVLTYLIQFSGNIEKFIFDDSCKYSSEFENSLKLLFFKNKKLKSLSIPNVEITGECLLSLPFRFIEKISIFANKDCINADHLKLAFSKVNNLKNLELQSNYENIKVVLEEIAIEKNNITCLKLSKQDKENLGKPDFSKYFSTMINLNEVQLNNIEVNKNDLISLPANMIRKFDFTNCVFHNDNETISCLPSFINLEEIKFLGIAINNEFCDILAKCTNLKIIGIYCGLATSNFEIKKIRKLPKLKELRLEAIKIIIVGEED